MSYKKIFSICTALFVCNFANAATIYDNGISALNINMLTQNLMQYAHRGESMSQNFRRKNIYGTMTRLDEYGDDGSTLKTSPINSSKNSTLFSDVWIDFTHINTRGHYNHANISERDRFYLATIGGDIQNINTKYGDILFGGFINYITGDASSIDKNGNSLGLYARYEYSDFDATVLINNGSINNDSNIDDFTNAWFNVAVDASWKFHIDKTLYFQPQIYVGYNWVSSDSLYINSDTISSKNFAFFNIAPGAKFIKNIIDNWYGALSVKYMATFGDEKDIYVNDLNAAKIAIDNYTQIDMNIEYDYKQFVFGAGISKQFGGFDGWIGNINAKYLF